ncbi:MAG: pyruvate dehydrogenase complex dihydrolipoamide acetyltransferase [Opitutus sp.]|nr:pyruvate dehydrogenase complex dihydrolipoamide acetyltransferase [Opitutus sp.]
MANIIEMPKLSDTMTVGTLAKWLKKEGDVVKSGDMLAEVETDKATMELESFFDGTLLKIFTPNGAQVALGAALCAIGKPGEKVEAPPSTAPASATAAPAPVAAPTPVQPATVLTPAATLVPAAEPSVASAQEGRVKISPLARKLAAEKSLDPSHLTGSGPGGRIVRADVEAAAARPAPHSQISNSKSQIGAPGAKGPVASGPSLLTKGPIQEERTVPVSNMRAAIARRLLESKTQLPHFYVEIEIDAEPLLVLREQLNIGLEQDGVKLSVNDFILKASAEALRRVPQVNGSWEGDQIRYLAAAHVSFAVAIEDGLITPVIRDTHLKSLFQISAEAKSLGKLAKDKKLKPEQFTGGTFCVSNLGMMGIPKFSAIINPPNAAILAIGTTVKKPVVKNDRIVVGQTMTLTLSCDHRVVDGAVGARYLGALKQLLESPALLLV